MSSFTVPSATANSYNQQTSIQGNDEDDFKLPTKVLFRGGSKLGHLHLGAHYQGQKVFDASISLVFETMIQAMRGNNPGAKAAAGLASEKVFKTIIREQDIQCALDAIGLESSRIGNPLKDGDSFIALLRANQLKDSFPKNKMIDLFFERFYIDEQIEDPEGLTRGHLLDSAGFKNHNKYFTPISEEHDKKMKLLYERNLASLKQFKRVELSPKQQISYDVLKWYLEDKISGSDFDSYSYLFSVANNLPTQIQNLLTNFHTIETIEDAENYIARFKEISSKLEQAIEYTKKQHAKGIIPPLFVYEAVIQKLIQFTQIQCKDNAYFTAFKSKVEALSPKEAEPWQKEKLILFASNEMPYLYLAHTKTALALEKLSHDCVGGNGGGDGAWKLPDGKKYYEWCLRHQTSTDCSAEQIHQMGQDEVDLLQKEAQAVLAKADIQKVLKANIGLLTRIQRCVIGVFKSIGQIFVVLITAPRSLFNFLKERRARLMSEQIRTLKAQPKFQYTNDEKGRNECITDYGTILQENQKKLTHLFDIQPKAILDVGMIIGENNPIASYQPAPQDGSRSAIFSANLTDMTSVVKFGMRDIALHEGIPGHHFQIGLAKEMQTQPAFQKHSEDFSGFVEGWGLYAEQLGLENQVFKDNFEKVGFYMYNLLRACRSVVDTGIHHNKWTRKQAIDYIKDNTGLSEVEATNEVDKSIVLPGRACAYLVGKRKIMELRNIAQKNLGDRFDMKEFHRIVLQNGAMPLKVLEKVVLEYVGATMQQKKKAN